MDIAEIIIKKLNNQLNEEENKAFIEWFESSDENQAVFERLKEAKTQRGNIPVIDDLDSVLALDKLILNYRAKRKKRLIFSIMKYASIVVIFLVGGYSIWQYSRPNIVIDPNSVTLNMGDGKIIALSSNNLQNIIDDSGNFVGTSNQSEIDYTKTVTQDEIAYNCLKVPNGKNFNVRLSDGTLVHLNAGSSLKYPTKFCKKGFRKVTLLGEAFFEVSKDKKHPFVVNANNLNITVLGTKFNVSSYPEDTTINTVLVEGSVKLAGKDEKKAQFLKPGFKAEWTTNNEKIAFSKVDTSVYTKWMEKGLVIDELPFDKIITKLERFYGVKIENRNQNLKEQIYTAEFSNKTINQVLDTFRVDTPFEYKMTNNQIIIY
ncbi:FecR family protein [Flavobacterium sp. 5]|uniref:FecR family protein n=1 Tax=Flavobacterium sp. 5 TaxID=2035199 RepID=UPI000C2C92EE|nr:FecR family protein [Flavobacterium sp. 5]PKB15150.1 FecR family protein [Flavobacterium sp. 5]